MMKRFFLSTIISAASVFAMAQTQSMTHIVQRGETIESIAEYYHVSVDDINKANPNADGLVYVGMKLVIPADLSKTNAKENTTSENTTRPSNNVTSSVKAMQYTEDNKVKITEENFKEGLQFARIKASLLFPTEIEKSSLGHYRSSYNLSFVIEGEYVFNRNLFTGFGLGYMGSGSCNSDRVEDRYQQFQSNYNYIVIPLSVGYRVPLTKNSNVDFYTGPAATIALSGYTKTRNSTSSEWEKTTLKDMKNVKYFVPYWNVGARINLWGIELGAEYWYLLTKINEGGSKGAIAAYFALHI